MENMEMNEVVSTEAIEEIKDAAETSKWDLKSVGLGGLIACGVMAFTKYVAVPAVKRVKGYIADKKAAKRLEKAVPADSAKEDEPDVDLDEDLKIDD